jgi:hypothetical protein
MPGFLNTVMNLRIPHKAKNFLNSEHFPSLLAELCIELTCSLQIFALELTTFLASKDALACKFPNSLFQILNNGWPRHTRAYPKVSGLSAWTEDCKWYSSLPLGAVVSLYCDNEFCRHNPLCCFLTS